MNALTIPTDGDAVVFLAERLGRLRPLEEMEVRTLHLAIRRQQGAFRRWTSEEDAKLLRMHKAKIRGAEMAKTLNRSEDGVTARLRVLKKGMRRG